MRGNQHLAFGIVTSIATMAVAQNTGAEIDPDYFVLLAGLGSLLPDIDTPTSTLGKIIVLQPISIFLNKTIGHRTLTHDLLLTTILAVLTTARFPILIGLWFGYFGHLFLDGMTTAGIPLLKKRVHFLPQKIKVYSGSNMATVVTILMSVLYCCGSYLIYQHQIL